MVSGKANSSSSGSDSVPESDAETPSAGRFSGRKRRERKARPAPRPIDQTGLHDLALSYVARFATTGAKLESYLARKLRERGTPDAGAGEAEAGSNLTIDIPAIVSRMIDLGYVDDDAYARMRSRDLAARGFGARRIEQALWAAGVDEDTRADHAPDEAGRRRAAIQLAKKRRFGPFGQRAGDAADGDLMEQRKAREKAVAAMLRAGHEFAHASFILDAPDIAEIEEWLAEAECESGPDERDDTRW